jgi:hypothetical protein
MTDKKSKTKSSWAKELSPYERKSYEDEAGISKVVLVPNGETDLKKGIPVSFDLSSLFGHMPKDFQRDLYAALHAQGLIEPKDFFAMGAADRYQRAIRTLLKHDFLSIQALAAEEIQHKK